MILKRYNNNKIRLDIKIHNFKIYKKNNKKYDYMVKFGVTKINIRK